MAVGSTVARQLDVRFIAATNVPLETAVREGKFRQDLFYRLTEFTIQVPPLRERADDILLLAQRFREEASLELRRPVAAISEEACRAAARPRLARQRARAAQRDPPGGAGGARFA